MMVDKARKLEVGFRWALEKSPSYVMPMDADDLVDRNLVDFAVQRNEGNGYYVAKGFAHKPSRRWCIEIDNFDEICGTSSAIRVSAARGALRRKSDWFWEVMQLGHHVRRQAMAAAGRPLARVPFRAVVYSVGTGQNHSGDFWRNRFGSLRKAPQALLALRPVSGRMRECFPGIEDNPRRLAMGDGRNVL